jgi:arabinan endo-1,5-alpha-L-arabinosidase
LDVYNHATTDGARITQWTRNDGAWQQWQFVDSGGGYYRLRSRHSGKVLDVSNRSTVNGANIVQWADLNGTNQQFRLADSEGGYVRLVNRNSEKALDILNFSTANGAQLVQWTDLGGANQQWQLVQLGGGYPNPGTVAGDVGVHDPSIVKRPGGDYLLAHTANDLALKTSADRVTFRNAGAVFPSGASWTTTYTAGSHDLWAPDLTYRNGQYYLYYSASTFGSNRSARQEVRLRPGQGESPACGGWARERSDHQHGVPHGRLGEHVAPADDGAAPGELQGCRHRHEDYAAGVEQHPDHLPGQPG